MIKKSNIPIYFSLAILLLIGIVYYALIYEKEINWDVTYAKEKDTPYGTALILKLLEDLSPEKEVEFYKKPLLSLPKDTKEYGHTNYIFIGDIMYLSSAEADSLLQFASQGNSVFISSNDYPTSLARIILSGYVEDVDAANLQETEDEDYEEDSEENDSDSLSTEAYEDTTTYVENTDTTTVDSTDTEDTYASEEDSLYYDTTETSESKQYYLLEKQLTDSIVHFCFRYPKNVDSLHYFDFKFLQKSKLKERTWTYINDTVGIKEEFEPIILGYLKPNGPAYIRYKIGKGELFFHSLPITLTNLYVKEKNGWLYANKIFSLLRPGRVLWDDYHSGYKSDSNGNGKSSPLGYILSQPPLQWAWYLALIGIFIYFLFYSKRRQRVIAVLNPLQNTTIEYVQTLSEFFKKSGYQHIADIKMKNWKIYVWERYRISQNLHENEFIEKVATFSGLSQIAISKIIVLHKQLVSTENPSFFLLEDFNNRIELFYKKCK